MTTDNTQITMTKRDLINLLVESYVTGIKTVKEIVSNSANPNVDELYDTFKSRFEYYEGQRNHEPS